MKNTLINRKWELILPDHRAARPEWASGWEVERIDSMMSKISPGDVVLDIGTEEGDISALLSSAGAEMILFEPNDRVWPNIKAIWEANNLERPLGCFSGFAAATTDLRGKNYPDLALCWPKSAEGELIGDHGFKELSDPGSIPQTTIDDYLKWIMRKVDMITIDVEGSEFEVLKGAVQTIRAYEPFIYVSIHPEFMFRLYGQYTAELVKFVTDLGYSYKVLTFDHEFHFLFEPL